MKHKAILFDMDGTLLPMDMKEFINCFTKELLERISLPNVPQDVALKNMWLGIKSMVENDGSKTNEEVFLNFYESVYGKDQMLFIEQRTKEFYHTDFHKARSATGENPLAKEAVCLAHQKAELVILATNPLFPLEAQKARLSWLGLTPEDFDLVTCYENSNFCKPNPEYYHMICKKMNLKPEECLMIGNDVKEDMQTCTAAGMDGYLVTDCIIPCEDYAWTGPSGTFAEMLTYL